MKNKSGKKAGEAGKHFNDIYKTMTPEEIPWNSVEPPELLVELVESGQVKVGRALDLGCGLGNYAIWLAGLGFDVVGLDASPTAIKIAKENIRKQKLTAEHAENAEKKIIKKNLSGLGGEYRGKCRFMVADLTGKWPFFAQRATKGRPDLKGNFDFVYEWGLLHHIPPAKRPGYVKNVHRVLKPGGKYVSVCFNVKDKAFEGKGKVRNTHLDTVVYLSSKAELRKLFGRFFKIIDFRVLEIQGKIIGHVFNYCFMEKKN